MPPDIATYILAQRAGVRLHRHLDAETLEQVAAFEERLRGVEATSPSSPQASRPRRRQRPTPEVTETRIEGVRVPVAALSRKQRDDADRMARFYPILYAFENSVREFVDGHLSAAYGHNWWEGPKIVSTPIRRKVERNRSAEARHRYHSRRNAPPI